MTVSKIAACGPLCSESVMSAHESSIMLEVQPCAIAGEWSVLLSGVLW